MSEWSDMENKQVFSAWYVLAALIVMISLQAWFGTGHSVTLSCSEYKQALAAVELADVLVPDAATEPQPAAVLQMA